LLSDETGNIKGTLDLEILSDEEEIYSGHHPEAEDGNRRGEIERRDSSASGQSNGSINQPDGGSGNQKDSNNPAPDTVSLSRISIRSFDSNQSYETSSIVSASEIRKRLQTATEKE
jgi:hypothetical protein